MTGQKDVVNKAFQMIRHLPRVSLGNIANIPKAKNKSTRGRGDSKGNTHGAGVDARRAYYAVGSEAKKMPFFMKFPQEKYYQGHNYRREYPPLSLGKLQTMIDLNRIDISKPIDLATLCGTGIYHLNPLYNHYGVNLVDEGIDTFKSKINIEVQWASEPVIAAVEKHGGTITTAYYDIQSVSILIDPEKFFDRGIPIPKRLIPPENAIMFYTSPATRGYLSDPDEISWERLVLAQKYGYKLPRIEDDPDYEMLMQRKDPRQIFYGLEPGWLINLREKVILKSVDPEFSAYFKS